MPRFSDAGRSVIAVARRPVTRIAGSASAPPPITEQELRGGYAHRPDNYTGTSKEPPAGEHREYQRRTPNAPGDDAVALELHAPGQRHERRHRQMLEQPVAPRIQGVSLAAPAE